MTLRPYPRFCEHPSIGCALTPTWLRFTAAGHTTGYCCVPPAGVTRLLRLPPTLYAGLPRIHHTTCGTAFNAHRLPHLATARTFITPHCLVAAVVGTLVAALRTLRCGLDIAGSRYTTRYLPPVLTVRGLGRCPTLGWFCTRLLHAPHTLPDTHALVPVTSSLRFCLVCRFRLVRYLVVRVARVYLCGSHTAHPGYL